MGSVSTKNIVLSHGDYSVYETTLLKNMLGVLSDDINITVQETNGRNTALNLNDGSTNITFVLVDSVNIPVVPTLKQLPSEFEISIELDKPFIEKFIKATNALSDVETFTILSDGKKTSLVLGYSKTNTNRVTIITKTTKVDKIDPIDFH